MQLTVSDFWRRKDELDERRKESPRFSYVVFHARAPVRAEERPVVITFNYIQPYLTALRSLVGSDIVVHHLASSRGRNPRSRRLRRNCQERQRGWLREPLEQWRNRVPSWSRGSSVPVCVTTAVFRPDGAKENRQEPDIRVHAMLVVRRPNEFARRVAPFSFSRACVPTPSRCESDDRPGLR